MNMVMVINMQTMSQILKHINVICLVYFLDGINVSEREEFVRFCFSSLLEFVLKGPTNVSAIVEMQSGEDGKKIAVLALLQRFQSILLNYKEYVNHNSHIPIQRYAYIIIKLALFHWSSYYIFFINAGIDLPK